MKTIGVIGGLGPMATVYYLEWIVRQTVAESDQEHPRIYLESIPDIPDRTDYILGKSNDNPYPMILQAAQRLIQSGADFITIPCVTAFYFVEQLQKELSKPVLSLPELLVKELQNKGIKKVGILATNGTNQSGVLSTILRKNGIECVVPDEAHQKMVMEIIYGQIKKGTPVNIHMFHEVEMYLLACGVKKIIMGCTEIPLIKKEYKLGDIYIDILEILARETVIESGAKLRVNLGD